MPLQNYSVLDAARLMGVTEVQARYMIKKGTLKAFHFGKRVLIADSELDRTIKRMRREGRLTQAARAKQSE